MAKLLCGLLVVLSLCWPGCADAAGIKFSISIAQQPDGTGVGELLINEKVIWRLKICSDGAEPVTAGYSANTTVVIPDLVNGLFLLRVGSQ